ncbi:MAG: hypothetical protein CMD09_03280 [Flavobacteriales bacterium]|nr:hypothetical protein [Flavobacteriales bacterium]
MHIMRPLSGLPNDNNDLGYCKSAGNRKKGLFWAFYPKKTPPSAYISHEAWLGEFGHILEFSSTARKKVLTYN